MMLIVTLSSSPSHVVTISRLIVPEEVLINNCLIKALWHVQLIVSGKENHITKRRLLNYNTAPALLSNCEITSHDATYKSLFKLKMFVWWDRTKTSGVTMSFCSLWWEVKNCATVNLLVRLLSIISDVAVVHQCQRISHWYPTFSSSAIVPYLSTFLRKMKTTTVVLNRKLSAQTSIQ